MLAVRVKSTESQPMNSSQVTVTKMRAWLGEQSRDSKNHRTEHRELFSFTYHTKSLRGRKSQKEVGAGNAHKNAVSK